MSGQDVMMARSLWQVVSLVGCVAQGWAFKETIAQWYRYNCCVP